MRFLLAILTSLVVGLVSRADEFRRQLEAAWGQLAELDTKQKTYVVEKTIRLDATGSKFHSQNRYTVCLMPDCGRLQSDRVVLCWNPQYAFNLKMSKGSQPGTWLLGELIIAPPAQNRLRQLMFANGTDLCQYRPLTALFSTTCDRCLADGHLHIVDHRPEGQLVRVSCELRTALGGDEAAKKEDFSGTLWLNPAEHLVIVEAVLTRRVLPPGLTEEERRIKLSRKVDRSDGGVLITTAVDYGTLTADKGDLIHTMYRYSDYRFVDTDLREFRISHYGIPEPVDVTWERPSSHYGWYLVAGIVFAIIAAIFTYIRCRRHCQSPRS